MKLFFSFHHLKNPNSVHLIFSEDWNYIREQIWRCDLNFCAAKRLRLLHQLCSILLSEKLTQSIKSDCSNTEKLFENVNKRRFKIQERHPTLRINFPGKKGLINLGTKKTVWSSNIFRYGKREKFKTFKILLKWSVKKTHTLEWKKWINHTEKRERRNKFEIIFFETKIKWNLLKTKFIFGTNLVSFLYASSLQWDVQSLTRSTFNQTR